MCSKSSPLLKQDTGIFTVVFAPPARSVNSFVAFTSEKHG